MRRFLLAGNICAAFLLGFMVSVDVGASSVQLSGYYGLADPARIVRSQRISGDATKVVYVEAWSNTYAGQSLSSWVSPQNPADADRARVWLYDIASQARTLLYQAKSTTVTSGADTFLQSMEDGFSVDINSDGSKVVMAYTATSFSGARDRLTSQLKIESIDTASLAVSPIASLGVPGFQGWNVPLRMSELAGTAVFAYEAVGDTTSNVWGVTYDNSSGVTKLMTLALTPGAQPVELCNSGVHGTANYNELINFIDSRYAGFFDVSADGTRVVFQHSGDGKVIGVMSNGSGWREIASVTPAKAAYVSISGDGQTVAYADRGANFAVLYANSFDGGAQREINRDMTYWAGHLILNGDGSNLLYHSHEAGPGGAFGFNATSYQIATAAGATPEMIAYELRDASGLGAKVLTSEYNSASLSFATITPLGAGSTTSTTSTTTSSSSTTTSSTEATTTTTVSSTTSTTLVHQPLFGANLIVNGDAEVGTGSTDGSVVAIPGWTAAGGPTVVTYENSSGYPTLADPGPVHRGMNFFAGGAESGIATISQTIDISAAAAEIDAGQVSYFLTGFLGGWSAQADNAVLSVDFKDGSSAVVGSGAIGPVSNAERNNTTGLLFKETTAPVPSGARSVDVKLQANRIEGTVNDGYADNLALVLIPGGGGSSTTSTTTTTTGGATTTTTASTTTTTLGGTGGPVALNFVSGWNLVGNSNDAIIDVATTFADATKISTVWKWVASKSSWAFYTPTLGDGGAAYASGKGYDFLGSINGGEGFWVNAKGAFTVQLPSGTAVTSASFQNMAQGWNLIAVGDNPTPSGFNRTLSLTPPSAGDIPLNVTTLWAWSSAESNWYFYAPSLEKNGGLSSYIQSKNYLDFGTKKLDPTFGFWVNKP